MPMTPCLDCGKLIPKPLGGWPKGGRRKRAAGRCEACYAANGRYVSSAETRRRKAAVDAHVAQHGYVCPGWGVEAHPATDLTADHITPVRSGGSESGPLQVLCRPCNGRKGDRPWQPIIG